MNHPVRIVSPALTDELFKLNTSFINCQQCLEYSQTKKPAVGGHGLNVSGIMFVGQSPGPFGADETSIPFTRDKSGRRFQQLLSDLHLKFDECYTTNLVKFCPGWGELKLEWIEHSRNHLAEEIKLVEPNLIVTFGKWAFLNFCPMGILRHAHGRLQTVEIDGIPCELFPLYHFAYYLRGGNNWSEFGKDVERLKKIIHRMKEKQLIASTTQKELINFQ